MAYAELSIDQGSTFLSTVDLVADDGTPIDLSGYTLASQIRKSYYSLNPTANLTVTIQNAATGNVSIYIDAANTANIRAGRYLYDIKMTSITGVVTRIVEGIVTIYPQVTKN